MSKGIRQYLGIFTAVVVYFLVHEGAHFLYAVSLGVFRKINFLGLGIQIDVFREQMTDTQLGFFCLAGAAATLVAAYGMTLFTSRFCRLKSKVIRAMAYYVTITLLFLDPMYLGILSGFFGGGDMNGIVLLVPEVFGRGLCILVLVVNLGFFFKFVLPQYQKSFS